MAIAYPHGPCVDRALPLDRFGHALVLDGIQSVNQAIVESGRSDTPFGLFLAAVKGVSTQILNMFGSIFEKKGAILNCRDLPVNHVLY